jgi:integrase
MFALAVALLTAAPVRVNNLAGLQIERHFVHTRNGATRVLHLVIPAAETKNSEPYEVEVPKGTAALLARYLATYHPRLSPGSSPWLFPNDVGERRDTTAFATEIVAFVLRETGIQMNVHLFRHLAAKLYWEKYPEDIETVRRMLGHKSITTTLRYYAEMKSTAAFRRYDEVIRGLREQAGMRELEDTKPAGDRS